VVGIIVLTLTTKSERPKHACATCGYTWYPRGEEAADTCPECEEGDIFLWPGATGCGWLCLGIVALFLVIVLGRCRAS